MIKKLLFAAGLSLLCTISVGRTLTPLSTPRDAPSFQLPDLDGAPKHLEDFKGRYLLVNFWAVWCTPCRAEMPSMQRLYETLGDDDLAMLAVHVGPSAANAKQYAKTLGLKFPIVVDENMALSDWQVQGLPTTYLVDPQGRIVAKAVGERHWDSNDMRKALQQLIGKPAASGKG